NRDGEYNIYAQRFDSSGNPVGFNFKINDDASVARQVEPSIGMDSDGNFIVAWIDGRDGRQDIYAERFDNTATPMGANLRVNEDAYTIMGWGYVSTSMSDAGIFGVTWTTAQGDMSNELCVKFFNWTTGEPIDHTSVEATSYVYLPHIGMDASGISTVIWSNQNIFPQHVMARRYDSSGDPINTAYVIDDSEWSAGPSGAQSPIDVRPSGEVVVSFHVTNIGMNPDPFAYVHVRRFDASGNPIGPSFRVDAEQTQEGVIAIKPEGTFVVVYQKRSTGDLYARKYDWSENPLGDSTLLNDDGNYLSQKKPKIAVATPNTFMVVWEDARDKGTDSNIYGRIFQISDDSAVPIGEDFRIPGDGSPWKSYGYTDISGSSSGRFVVVWTETDPGGSSGAYAQTPIRVYDVSGTLIASKLHYTTWDAHEPSVAITQSGNFVVAKREFLNKIGEGYETDIFLTLFNPDATVITDIRVNPSEDNGASQFSPQVAMNDNTVLVAWNDPREGRDDVWARGYRFPDGNPLTDEFIVHEDISQTGHYLAGVAIDDDGRFIITWNDRREGDWDIYARRFNPDFTPMGPEFKVNDDELAGVEQKGGDAVMTSSENGDFAITWYDWRDGDPDVYIRLYGGDGNPKADSFRISALHDSQQLIPAVTGTEDNIVAAWLDNRNGDWDVYARLKSWETLSVAVSISPESLEIKHWDDANFTVIVENDGAEQDSYNLDVTGLPDGFVWEMETFIADLPPGEFVELPLKITPAYEQGVCENIPYPFSVTGTSVANPDISSTAEAEFTIKPNPCGKKTGDVSGDGTISAYDAALILKFVVGLIDEFDCESMAVSTTATPRNYSVSLSNIRTTEGKTIYAPIIISETAGLTAGGIVLTYDPTVLKTVDVAPLSVISGSYWKANFKNPGEVRFAFASTSEDTSHLEGNGELLLIKFETLPNTTGKVSPLILDNVQLTNSLNITKIDGSITILPERTLLMQNYPNPFNPETWLPYQLAADAPVTIHIYNQRGQFIRAISLGHQPAGVYINRGKAAYWDGRNNAGEKVSSGMYFYNLQAGKFTATRRMLIVK
nr:T9SS type A sorting domain-containing protein [bacterium]